MNKYGSEKSARAQVGDGKLPNKYWVCTSGEYYVNRFADGVSCSEWAGEVYPDFKAEKGETYGPFDTFAEALAVYNDKRDYCAEPTVENALHSLVIEDRISGEVYQGIWTEYTKKAGRYLIPSFQWSDYDETKFTREKLGADFR